MSKDNGVIDRVKPIAKKAKPVTEVTRKATRASEETIQRVTDAVRHISYEPHPKRTKLIFASKISMLTILAGGVLLSFFGRPKN